MLLHLLDSIFQDQTVPFFPPSLTSFLAALPLFLHSTAGTKPNPNPPPCTKAGRVTQITADPSFQPHRNIFRICAACLSHTCYSRTDSPHPERAEDDGSSPFRGAHLGQPRLGKGRGGAGGFVAGVGWQMVPADVASASGAVGFPFWQH